MGLRVGYRRLWRNIANTPELPRRFLRVRRACEIACLYPSSGQCADDRTQRRVHPRGRSVQQAEARSAARPRTKDDRERASSSAAIRGTAQFQNDVGAHPFSELDETRGCSSVLCHSPRTRPSWSQRTVRELRGTKPTVAADASGQCHCANRTSSTAGRPRSASDSLAQRRRLAGEEVGRGAAAHTQRGTCQSQHHRTTTSSESSGEQERSASAPECLKSETVYRRSRYRHAHGGGKQRLGRR